jgi:hypothetical protein
MKRHTSPALRVTKNASVTPAISRSGYLSSIKAAAASQAAVSTFAATSKALANARTQDQSPIDIEWLNTPSQAHTGNHRPFQSPSPSAPTSRAKTPTSARTSKPFFSSAPETPSSAHASQPQLQNVKEHRQWAARSKTLRAVLQPTPSSAAPFFEALGCNNGAIGVIRLPRNAAAHLYPASPNTRSHKTHSASGDFFICARDEQSGTEWKVELQLELEGAACLDALSAHNENRRALHSQQELEEAVRSRDALVEELASSEKQLLELKLTIAAANQREAAALDSNACLLQRVTTLESDLRLSENHKHELKGRLSQVAATAESEHSRLAASECALREQNAAQLKRIAVLEERVEAAHRLQADHEHALAALSETQKQLQKANDEKTSVTRDLHSRIDKCKSLERQLSKAREASAEDEKAVFAARAAAARALDEAAACRLKCNELDGASWSHKDKLLKTQEVLAPLRKRADAAEHLVEKYERQLEEAEQKERRSMTHASRLEKENKDLKIDVQSLAAEKQVLRLELLQANLENDKVTLNSANNAVV